MLQATAVIVVLGPSSDRVTPTLLAASIGIKHQVEDRTAYLARLAPAIDLLLLGGEAEDDLAAADAATRR